METIEENPELAALTSRMARVLRAAHAAGREVENYYGDVISTARGQSTWRPGEFPNPGASLQELDRLVQVLENLARFLEALGPLIPAGMTVEVAPARAQILMRDLVWALLSDAPAEAPSAHAEEVGEEDGLHLF